MSSPNLEVLSVMIVIELADGYVTEATSECVSLTADPSKAWRFASEDEALKTITSRAPHVVASQPWIKISRFYRGSGSIFQGMQPCHRSWFN